VALRFPVSPMKASLGSLPPATEDELWSYEIKWDGYRTIAFVEDGSVRLQSTKGLDATRTYPEIGGLPEAVNAASAILDGELVVLDADGRPTFEGLQRHETQAAYYMFDVLQIGGKDTIALPYEQRRALLGELVEAGSNWMVPAHRVGDGAALLAATVDRGLEGVMAKRLGSTYTPGTRTPHWRKVKNRRRLDVVIGGFTPGSGNRSGTFGALLVGLPQPDGSLRFAGGVGTGFSHAFLETLTKRLRSIAVDRCPFSTTPPRTYTSAGVTWVRPELGATLELTELTNEGYVRQASFIELLEP
jgi:bifunctional non-homologous end joining protein LigD